MFKGHQVSYLHFIFPLILRRCQSYSAIWREGWDPSMCLHWSLVPYSLQCTVLPFIPFLPLIIKDNVLGDIEESVLLEAEKQEGTITLSKGEVPLIHRTGLPTAQNRTGLPDSSLRPDSREVKKRKCVCPLNLSPSSSTVLLIHVSDLPNLLLPNQ